TAIRGVPGAVAAASIVADITISLTAQIVLTLAGLWLLIHLTHRVALYRPALIGFTIAIVAVGGFYAAQRFGIFGSLATLGSKIFGGGFAQLVNHGESLDRLVQS